MSGLHLAEEFFTELLLSIRRFFITASTSSAALLHGQADLLAALHRCSLESFKAGLLEATFSKAMKLSSSLHYFCISCSGWKWWPQNHSKIKRKYTAMERAHHPQTHSPIYHSQSEREGAQKQTKKDTNMERRRPQPNPTTNSITTL